MPNHTPRILIIDDERAIATMLASALRSVGTVDTAFTVEAASAQLLAHSYDAAVLDMLLDTDTTVLRAALQDRGIPVLLVSGRDGDRLQREAKEHGWAFLAKPFTQVQVQREIEALLDKGVASDTGIAPASAPPSPPSPAPSPASDHREAPKSAAIEIIDRLADVAGVIGMVMLALHDKIDGNVAVGAMLGVLGVSGGVRHIGRRSAGLATAAIAIFAALTTLAHPSAASASHRSHGDRHAFSGYAAVRTIVVAAVIALAIGVISCHPLMRALMDSTEGVPPYVGCEAGVPVCAPVPGERGMDGGFTPAVCSGQGRFWPLLPRTADGRQRVCAIGCTVDREGHPVCLEPADAATDATDVVDFH